MARTKSLKGGRGLKVKIDREALKGLAKIQCTLEEAAAFFECDERTIKRRLANDIELRCAWDDGKALGRASLRRLQWRHAQMANGAGVQMAIHLSKHWLGETEKAALELSGKVDTEVKLSSARERVNRKIDTLGERIAGRVAGLAAAVGATATPAKAE